MDGQRNWREMTAMSSSFLHSSDFYIYFKVLLLALVSPLCWLLCFCLSLHGRMLAETRMRDGENMLMLFGGGWIAEWFQVNHLPDCCHTWTNYLHRDIFIYCEEVPSSCAVCVGRRVKIIPVTPFSYSFSDRIVVACIFQVVLRANW